MPLVKILIRDLLKRVVTTGESSGEAQKLKEFISMNIAQSQSSKKIQKTILIFTTIEDFIKHLSTKNL